MRRPMHEPCNPRRKEERERIWEGWVLFVRRADRAEEAEVGIVLSQQTPTDTRQASDEMGMYIM